MQDLKKSFFGETVPFQIPAPIQTGQPLAVARPIPRGQPSINPTAQATQDSFQKITAKASMDSVKPCT